MKKDAVINQLKKSTSLVVINKLNSLISFLDNFFYFYDLMNETNYNEVFYYLYIEEVEYSYLEISDFINKNSTMQVYRIVKKMEEFIIKVLEENEYKELKYVIE
ncbi:MAG: hypothetical protein K2I42_01260 [Anaeroplasmataceae bacterium]|nr:hypothetical protein [Anaeroplasmataceae bacterium]